MINDWRRIVSLSISFWAQVAGILVLIIPEALFKLTGRDLDPALLWWIAILLLIFGLIGRVIRQSDDAKFEWVKIIAVLIVIGAVSFLATANAGSRDGELRKSSRFISFVGNSPFSVRVRGGLLVTPPVVDSVCIGSFRNTVFNGNVPPELTVFIFCDKSSVFALGLGANPPAIIWVISSEVVYSINGQVRFIAIAYSPISERFIVQPLFTNINMSISRIIGFGSAFFYPFPYIVESSFSFAMRKIDVFSALNSSTAATCGLAKPQVGADNCSFGSASTFTPPKCATTFGVPVLIRNIPQTKSFAS